MYIYSYFANDGSILYIGSTEQVLQRFRQHQQEEVWMTKVASITVRGPYSERLVTDFEKMYISKFQPVYNSNSLYYSDCSDFYDDSDVKCFSSVSEFVEYYSIQPDTYHRSTYYLRSDDLEVLRILSFHMNYEKSALVRDALKIGLTQIAKENGHEDIYREARRFICKSAKKSK